MSSGIEWIKELVKSEQQMEESGMVDILAGFDPKKSLLNESTNYLNELKACFVDAAAVFNELRASAVGRVKIYGIAKTQADFMLFRNGFKLIFSLVEPGKIAIRFNFISPSYLPSNPSTAPADQFEEEDLIEAQWGAFGDIEWKYKGLPVKMDSLVRFQLSRFLKESAR